MKKSVILLIMLSTCVIKPMNKHYNPDLQRQVLLPRAAAIQKSNLNTCEDSAAKPKSPVAPQSNWSKTIKYELLHKGIPLSIFLTGFFISSRLSLGSSEQRYTFVGSTVLAAATHTYLKDHYPNKDN